MTGIANAVNGPEAAPYLAKAGGTMAGGINMNSNTLTNVPTPSGNGDAANKQYVDDVAQGRTFKDPCAAATTGALTATYSNGSSGVGATLTNAGAMAAFSVDGYSASVGDRILIKNQASTFQNGIYTVTTVGSGAVNWVLTRSLDMDTASQFFGATTLIINGTVQAGQTWTETAVVVTVGTDAVTFVQTGDATGITSISAADATVTLTPDPIVATGTIAVNTATFVRTVKTQVFPATATYTPSTGLISAIVELVASGGGSGGAAGTAGQCGSSGGAGGGGYCRKFYTAADIGANAAVVIGAAGTAGSAGANAGGNASNSTFTPAGAGAVLTAGGGVGSAGAASSATVTSSNGGAGGTATGGDINIPGNAGTQGQVVLGSAQSNIPGQGGGTQLCPGGTNNPTFNGSVTSKVYGSGAAGAASGGGVDVAGAVGALGICIVTEFCNQ